MSLDEESLGLIDTEDPEHPDHPEFDSDGRKAKDRRNIVLIVFAPSDPDPKQFRFRVETTVGDAAREAADRFGYAPDGTPSFRTGDGKVLDRTKTLKQAGLEHRDEVELVDAGGGV